MKDAPPLRLIVGLGNPGPEYEATRHNIGFMVLQCIRQKLGWQERNPRIAANSKIYEGNFGGRKLWLQEPQTFMNCSGKAVANLMTRQTLLPQEVLVVYDELDLPLGRMRFRSKGSSGGHRGVQSLIDSLQTSGFHRLRIGIGQATDTIEHVLGAFTPHQQPLLQAVLTQATDAAITALTRDVSTAQATFNGKVIELDSVEKSK